MHNRWTVKTTRNKLIEGECRELLFSDQLGINPRGVFSPLFFTHVTAHMGPIYIYPRGVFSPLCLFHTCNHPYGPCIYMYTVHKKYNRESLVLCFLTDPIIGSPGAIEVCSDLHFCLVLTRSTCRSWSWHVVPAEVVITYIYLLIKI
jgi:hypothetical protein